MAEEGIGHVNVAIGSSMNWRQPQQVAQAEGILMHCRYDGETLPMTMRQRKRKFYSPDALHHHFDCLSSFYIRLKELEVDADKSSLRELIIESNSNSSSLWTIKHAPAKFSELISPDVINFDLIKWLGQWRGDAVPATKIMLISGPPGLGKTTLAHVAARTAGFDIVEINASDERSGEVLLNRVRSIVSSKPLFSQKPSCLVIDEIDGVSDASASSKTNLVAFLAHLISHEAMDGAEEPKTQRFTSRRPIICICNDLYAPSIRTLRKRLPYEAIIKIPKPSAIAIAKRLRNICDTEGLIVDTRALIDMVEEAGCDMRSCLNLLHFASRRSRTITATCLGAELRTYKDMHTPITSILEHIFCGKSSVRAEVERLRRTAESFNDSERLLWACFEHYQGAKFFDNYKMDRVNTTLEYISWFAQFYPGSRTAGYDIIPLLIIHHLFASPSNVRSYVPRLEADLCQTSMRHMATLTSFYERFPVNIRRNWTKTDVLHDLIPELAKALLPTDTSAYRTFAAVKEHELKEMTRIRLLAADFGITFRQCKTAEGQYYYATDP